MDRRSFIATLAGSLAAISGGAALARDTAVAAPMANGEAPLDTAALDETDAEFSHMPPGPRWRAHRAMHRRRWARRRNRRRMRRAWRRGRWHYY